MPSASLFTFSTHLLGILSWLFGFATKSSVSFLSSTCYFSLFHFSIHRVDQMFPQLSRMTCQTLDRLKHYRNIALLGYVLSLSRFKQTIPMKHQKLLMRIPGLMRLFVFMRGALPSISAQLTRTLHENEHLIFFTHQAFTSQVL